MNNLRAFCFFVTMALSGSASAQSVDEPRLLLLLTIDQGRGDYLERFAPALEGGLAKLMEEGVVFTDAHHAHAYTVTAAGHASLSTGRHPSHSGMVGNNFYDRTRNLWVYCLEDHAAPILLPEGSSQSSPGRSPKNLLVSGLGDWIQEQSPRSKVYSVGAKDRASILMGGRGPSGAYWYDNQNGHWVTSQHYQSAYPDWVQRFHRERRVRAYFGETWTPLAVSNELLERMEIDLAGGPFVRALGGASFYPNTAFNTAVFYSPFIETTLFDFAERLVAEESLGKDDTIDVLALSFASVDTVGHRHGPNSRELLDTILRLDRELGEFFDYLDEVVGLDRVAISLSADHGVSPTPEYQMAHGLPGARRSGEDTACMQRAGLAFERKFGEDDWFVRPNHFNDETLARRSVPRADAESFLKSELARCPNVVAVHTATEIEAALAGGRVGPELEPFARSYHPERSPNVYIVETPYMIGDGNRATHGSPHPYDTHVLALIRWPGAAPMRVAERVHTVDLPVTLAALLGVRAPADADGVDRSRFVR